MLRFRQDLPRLQILFYGIPQVLDGVEIGWLGRPIQHIKGPVTVFRFFQFYWSWISKPIFHWFSSVARSVVFSGRQNQVQSIDGQMESCDTAGPPDNSSDSYFLQWAPNHQLQLEKNIPKPWCVFHRPPYVARIEWFIQWPSHVPLAITSKKQNLDSSVQMTWHHKGFIKGSESSICDA